MSASRDIAVYFIAGLLFACALQLRDIRNEMRMLTCITLAENGIRCPALKEKIADVRKGGSGGNGYGPVGRAMPFRPALSHSVSSRVSPPRPLSRLQSLSQGEK